MNKRLSDKWLFREEHFGIMLVKKSDGERQKIDPIGSFILKMCSKGSSTRDIIISYSERFDKPISESKEEVIEFISLLEEKGILKQESKNNQKITKNPFLPISYLSSPRAILWEITPNCNYNCIHCYSKSGPHHKTNLTTIKRTIDSFSDMGVFFISIGGGEPLLRDDIFEIVRYAEEKEVLVELTTNGSLLTGEVIEKLKDSGLKFVQISIDGKKETHNRIRGCLAAYYDAVNAARISKEAGLNTSIAMTVMKENQHEVEDIANLAKSIGINSIRAIRCMPFGNAAKDKDNLPFPEEWLKVVERLRIISKENPALSISYDKTFETKKRRIDWLPEEFLGCSAGRTVCCITAQGDVFPCTYLKYEKFLMGNINKEKFSDIWHTKNIAFLRELRHLDGRCSSCNNKSLCMGGCRALAYQKYRDIHQSDPSCYINQEG